MLNMSFPYVNEANFVSFQCPNTVPEWMTIANEFKEVWNLPQCLGALGGKHISIRKPACSGSKFFNYKHFFSIILLAVCDAQYRFLFCDIGSQGRCSDAGVFAESELNVALQQNLLNIPEEQELPGTDIKFPFFLVADEAFPLREYLMKPYPQRKLSKEKRICNYRISRARRCVENAFGIMANRFRVLLNPICLKPDKVDGIVLACCALHNMLRTVVPTRYTALDDETCEGLPPSNRSATTASTSTSQRLTPARVSGRRSSTQAAKELRDTLCDYLNSDAGSVAWQHNMI